MLATREILGVVDLSPGAIVEVLSRAADKSKVLLTSFLKLPHVKALQFALEVGLVIGRTISPSQNNNGLTPLPPVYILRDENLFRINLQVRHIKAVKDDDVEVETDIWSESDAEVFQGGYMAKRHEPLFQHLRNIIDKCVKHNVAIKFVRYMVESYGTSSCAWQVESRKEG